MIRILPPWPHDHVGSDVLKTMAGLPSFSWMMVCVGALLAVLGD